MNSHIYLRALSRVWHSRLIFCVLLLLVFLWIAAFWYWLSIPVAKVSQLVTQALFALVLFVLPLLFLWWAWRRFGGRSASRCFTSPWFWLALLIVIIAGFYLPFKIIWWIPSLQSLTAQSISAALRTIVAAKLLTFSLLWLCAVGALSEKANENVPADKL